MALSISFTHAQGMIPALPSAAVATSTAPVQTLLIGQKVPEALTVLDDQGKRRTLLSFKAPLEILVVYVFSGTCEAEQTVIPQYTKLYEKFKDWRVAFVELRNGRPAAPGQWSFPKVTDDSQRVYQTLGVQGTPMILVLDEGGSLRYRGTLERGVLYRTSISQALDAIIGHVQPVTNPEPAATLLCPAR